MVCPRMVEGGTSQGDGVHVTSHNDRGLRTVSCTGDSNKMVRAIQSDILLA